VEQSNFDSYRALRINEIPAIDIHIIDSQEPPGGMGEPGFAATGVRLRKLPIDTSKLKA
jgi:isoquinoline 1-oxidoreductase subunit beta